jgi:hypothetical protein
MGLTGTPSEDLALSPNKPPERRRTVKKLVIGVAAVAMCATPALADFWIVRDGSTNKCVVVDKKPTDQKVVIVGGDGKVYKTRAEAEKEVTVVCKSN